jgi:hypothetical protein
VTSSMATESINAESAGQNESEFLRRDSLAVTLGVELAQYFAKMSSNFCAPAGGLTVPAKISTG